MASGDKKKIGVVIGLFVVAAGIWYFVVRQPAPLSDSIAFVDVATGKKYNISRSKLSSIFPMANPESGTHTLLPIEERDGKTLVLARYREFLTQVDKENRYVDTKTLEVRPPK